jgi:hypothetical protein
VASFLGDATLVAGEVADGAFLGSGVRAPANGAAPGPAVLVLRSEVISIAGDERDLAGCDTQVQGQVEVAVFEGVGTYYEVRVPGIDGVVRVLAPRSRDTPSFDVGEQVWVGWRADEAPVVASPR